ncbi:MAG: sugar transporter [Desulfobacteraceae bacterium]|nr:sugar transporter [Desulfobacteraceae bacterium]
MRYNNISKIIFVFLFVAFFTSCASQLSIRKAKHPDVKSNDQKSASFHKQTAYVIQHGDKLEIKFFYNKALNETVTVRPDGKISLQMIDDVRAAGKTPAQLDRVLSRQYGKELKSPRLTVIVRSFTNQKIFLGGEIEKQGMVDYLNGMSILQAVYMAGGFRKDALPAKAVVIRKNADNRPVPLRVNIKKITKRDVGANFLLKPQDIVYIPKTAISRLNQFMDDYIRELMMFSGFGISFDYSLNDTLD